MHEIKVTWLRFIQHMEAVEVDFRYPDLQRAFAQMVLILPKDPGGKYLTGTALTAQIESMAPPRSWFEEQDARLAAQTPALQSLPAELKALAPIKPLGRRREWYEDENVQPAQLIGGEWARPTIAVDLRTPQNLATLKQRLTSEVANLRWAKETGGINVNGAMVLTDRESQATITGAYTRAVADPTTTVEWKAVNGFVMLDAAAIMQTGNAVFNHVQKCFSRERELVSMIEAAGTVHALLQIDISAGWGA